MPTLTVNPIIDTYIRENSPDSTYGSSAIMQTYAGVGSRRTPIVVFDLSSIPAGSTIDSATLSLFNAFTSGSSRNYWLYGLTAANADLVEECSWNYKIPSTNRWTGDTGSNGGTDAGGSVSGTDYHATQLGAFTYTASSPLRTEHAVSLDLTVSQAMLDAGFFGVRMESDEASNRDWYTSDEVTYTTAHPKLVIVYTEGGGGGPVTVTPSPVSAAVSTVGPTVILGAVTITPAPAVAVARTVAPSVVLGPVTVTPSPAVAAARSVAPTVILGAVTVTPSPVHAVARTVGPVVVLGPVTLTPAPAVAVAGTVGPVVIAGSAVTVTPEPAVAVARTVGPVVVLGPVVVGPAPAVAVAGTVDPVVVLGPVTVTPPPAVAVAGTFGPVVLTLGVTRVDGRTFVVAVEYRSSAVAAEERAAAIAAEIRSSTVAAEERAVAIDAEIRKAIYRAS